MPSRLLYIAIKLYLTVLLTLLTRISKKKSLIQPRGASCRAQFNLAMKHRSRACADFFRRWTVQTRANNAPLDHRDSTRRFFILVHPLPPSFFLSFTIWCLSSSPPFQLCTRVFEYASIRNFVDTRRIQRTFAETKRKLDPLGA